MPLRERDHPIQTLASGGPNEAFTMCVRLRGAHRRLHHVQRHRTKRLVDGGCEDAIAIADHESIGTIKR